MARPNYGPQGKARAKRLLDALLAYANDELDNGERLQIQVNWQTENQLVVRTKVRFLEELTAIDPYSGKLNNDQIKEALKRLEDFLEILEDNRTTTRGAEEWHFTLRLWFKRQCKEANLRQFDVEWERRQSEKSVVVRETSVLQAISDNKKYQDWGDAVGVPVFYGRTEQLVTLEQWTVNEGCRLLAVLGMGGIGKTSLVFKLAQQIQDQFDYIIWRSLRDRPPIEEVPFFCPSSCGSVILQNF